MKHFSLAILSALALLTTKPLPVPQAQKCETYEEDCDRNGGSGVESPEDGPSRPGEEDGGDGL